MAPSVTGSTGIHRQPLTAHDRYLTIPDMSLIRGLFWAALFVFFTFCFVVLFEYGTADFSNGFKTELEKAKSFVMKNAKPPPKDKK